MSWRPAEALIKDLIHCDLFGTPATDHLRLYRTMIPAARPRFYDVPRRAMERAQRPHDFMRRFYMRDPITTIDPQLWGEEIGIPWNSREDPIQASNVHKIEIDVEHYSAEELAVKIIGRFVVVKGQHGQRQERQGWASRQFIKKYKVPENVDLDQLRCDLVPGHFLVITAPIKKSAAAASRAVPIRTMSTLISPNGSPSEAEEEAVEVPPANANAGAQVHVRANSDAQVHEEANADAQTRADPTAHAYAATANGDVPAAPANADPTPALD